MITILEFIKVFFFVTRKRSKTGKCEITKKTISEFPVGYVIGNIPLKTEFLVGNMEEA